MMHALKEYFMGIIEDGDYLNDWLTHLPTWFQDLVMSFHNAVTLCDAVIYKLQATINILF